MEADSPAAAPTFAVLVPNESGEFVSRRESISAPLARGTTVHPMDIMESIKGLHELHRAGGLTEEEFTLAKQQILESPSSTPSQSLHAGDDGRSHRGGHRGRHHHGSSSHGSSTSSSSTSSSSSSSDSSSGSDAHFMVLPVSRVWKTLETVDSLSSISAPGDVVRAVVNHYIEVDQAQSLAGGDTVDIAVLPFETSSPPTPPAGPTATIDPGVSSPVNRGPYGTFGKRQTAGWNEVEGLSLNPSDEVRVRYFNSRGSSGATFADVELSEAEKRPSMYLSKKRADHRQVAAAMPLSHVASSPEMVVTELPFTQPPSTRSTSSSDSFLEQSLNWYWVDVSGKDSSEKVYRRTIRDITRRFRFCESFLINRDHHLTLPQVCESPTHPGQYLINLRVASHSISLADDSAQLLTNRWILLVNLNTSIIVSLHRIDTRSLSVLRHRWSAVMSSSEISFQQFLLKMIDDAIYSYQFSLDVHETLLDRCEQKLFSHPRFRSGEAASLKESKLFSTEDRRIIAHFTDGASSAFLKRMLSSKDTSPLPKGETNSFLHHLHRRTGVQLRMLNLTQPVLVEAFTKLRLCSKELTAQMTTSCRELSDRALEVRDDAKTLLDLHLSLQSFRTNELMAVLTRLSLFFTPLTFLAGVYGMNFRQFPELSWEYGYAYFWVACAVMVVLMQYFFRRAGF